jgi:hypothetical protein
MMHSRFGTFVRFTATIAIALFCTLARAHAWSQPHHSITEAALETLPAWQKTVLGDELTLLAQEHCLIPGPRLLGSLCRAVRDA